METEAPDRAPPVGDAHRIESVLSCQRRKRGKHPALEYRSEQLSYGELYDASVAFADRLAAAGVQHGDRVPIYLDKSFDYIIALYGVWLAGGIAIPINEALVPAQVMHIIRDSRSKVLVSSAARMYKTKMQDPDGVTVLKVEEDPHEAPTVRRREPPRGEDTPAAILYTSGSTGKPKGIVISHANLVAGSDIVTEYLGITEDDRLLSILPFGFDYGLNQLLGSVYKGATLVLQRSHLPADICRTLVEKAVTVMAAVPPLWIQLAQRHSPFLGADLPDLRMITNTGGVFPVDLTKAFREAHPHLKIVLMYGLSEAFRSTYLPPEEIDRRPGSIGIAIPRTELHVLDEELNPCPPHVKGELVHRGPTVALGYWEAPEATAACFRTCPQITGSEEERVVFSGDLVHRDEEGFLYFAGRRDQLIKSMGYRISVDEVEELLLGSERIAEVAVKGEADPDRGMAIIAHVVPSAPEVDESELRAYARKVLPTYMQPKGFVLTDHLPRTSSGKLNRKEL
jgi:amino acid adenylation domain-containing protein